MPAPSFGREQLQLKHHSTGPEIFLYIQEKLKLKDELEKGSAERTAIVNQLKNEVRQIFDVSKFLKL